MGGGRVMRCRVAAAGLGRGPVIAQRTVRRAVDVAGIGLHSGARVRATIGPAPPDTGIVFRRGDVCPPATIKACPANVVGTQLAVTLEHQGVRIATVEHLMAALAGAGIDNAVVDVAGPELPIMDGSAALFTDRLEQAGSVGQGVPRRYLKVTREVCYRDGDAVAKLAPHDGFRAEYTMRYDHPYFGSAANGSAPRQHAAVDFATASFREDLSRARTFGFLADIERLWRDGLARGGSLDNAIVIDDHGVLNDGGLRFSDELPKHKILDAIGDLFLCGCPVLGAFTGYQSGHASNHGLLRRLLREGGAYEIVTG